MMAAAGWALAKKKLIADEKPLSALLTNIALPAMVLNNLQIPFSVDSLRNMGVTALGMAALVLVGCGVGALVARIAGRAGDRRGAWIACVAFSNVLYMGQPLMIALYGKDASALIAPISIVFNPMSFLLGGWLLSGGRQGSSFKSALLQPTVLACLLGFILFLLPVRLPGVVQSTLGMLAAVNTPISMVIIGCQLAKERLRDIFLDREIYLLSLTRLVLAAVAGHFVLRLFISDPDILGVLTICACMPTAAIVPVLAAARGGDLALCSKTTFLSTLICVVTAPVIFGLLLR